MQVTRRCSGWGGPPGCATGRCRTTSTMLGPGMRGQSVHHREPSGAEVVLVEAHVGQPVARRLPRASSSTSPQRPRLGNAPDPASPPQKRSDPASRSRSRRAIWHAVGDEHVTDRQPGADKARATASRGMSQPHHVGHDDGPAHLDKQEAGHPDRGATGIAPRALPTRRPPPPRGRPGSRREQKGKSHRQTKYRPPH